MRSCKKLNPISVHFFIVLLSCPLVLVSITSILWCVRRPLIIELGVVPLLRVSKARHKECRDAVAEALRDLGYDDYND